MLRHGAWHTTISYILHFVFLEVIMSCTIEKVLSDARMLVNRLRDHDSAADNLIGQATVLHRRVDAMRTVSINSYQIRFVLIFFL